jgi:hypothetical protein
VGRLVHHMIGRIMQVRVRGVNVAPRECAFAVVAGLSVFAAASTKLLTLHT